MKPSGKKGFGRILCEWLKAVWRGDYSNLNWEDRNLNQLNATREYGSKVPSHIYIHPGCFDGELGPSYGWNGTVSPTL